MKRVCRGVLGVGWCTLLTQVSVAAGVPDLVRLKNGGMFRGTITEYIPGDHVVITLPNGQEQRVLAADLEYAGPGEKAPPGEGTAEVAPPERLILKEEPEAPAPIAPPPSDRIRIQLENEGSERLIFYVRDTSASFQQLCVAPCTSAVMRGTYKFALSTPDGKPVNQSGLLTVEEPSTLRGSYTSNSDIRGAGWALLGIGAVTATLAPFVAQQEECTGYSCTEEVDDALLGVMLIGGLIGVGVGLAMGLTRDEADVSIRSGIASRAGGRSGPPREAKARVVPASLPGLLRF